MDEETVEPGMTVGQRLKEAREAKGLSLEDIAASTRIPRRHLESLESSEWDKLPAQTYSIGFARNYAVALGLDRVEIGDSLKLEMGGYQRATRQVEVFETVDPARAMPKGLVIGAILGLLVAIGLVTWLSGQSTTPDAAAQNAVAATDDGLTVPPLATAVAPQGAVVLTAVQPVWLEIKDGAVTLKQGEMAVGERYEVPANAAAPTLMTGKPEALTINVGTVQVPAVGEAGRTVSNVSLLAADLMEGSSAAAAPAPPPAAAPRATRPAPRPAAPRQAAPVAPAPRPVADPATAPTNTAAPAQ